MNHKHPSEKCVDIGSGVCLRATSHGGADHIRNADGSMAGGDTQHLFGFIVAYDWPGSDERLEGHVVVDPHGAKDGRDVWTMTGSLEGGDLTLHPSVQAYLDDGTTPSIHGFVRDGKWVPA